MGFAWVVIPIVVFLLLVSAFVIIAQKGRRLRRSRALPPSATKGFLVWSENGRDQRLEIQSPFYLGKDDSNDLVLHDARAAFEACIFYHNKRFAIQALEGSAEIVINDAEMIAGYLNDGDQLRIAGRNFVFECY